MNEGDTTRLGPDLVLTMNAVDRLRSLLEESGDLDCRLRIRAIDSGQSPQFELSLEETPEPDDIEMDYARIAVLLDPESRARLRGHEVDHRRDEDGERFVIRRSG